MSVFEDVMSKTTEVNLFDNIGTNKMMEKDHTGIDVTAFFNEGNDTEIRQCQPSFDGLLCWSRTDAPGIATQPCPPALIMGYTDLANDNLQAFAVASKVCLANGEWYRNSNGVFWSNYSLCVPNSTRYMIDNTEKPNYLRLYETSAESSVLNVSFHFCIYISITNTNKLIINFELQTWYRFKIKYR